MASELDKTPDSPRNGTVDLAFLNHKASVSQIEAMVDVCLLHRIDDIATPNVCDCGWQTSLSGKSFEALEREFLAHMMADIVERVFHKPANPLTGR